MPFLCSNAKEKGFKSFCYLCWRSILFLLVYVLVSQWFGLLSGVCGAEDGRRKTGDGSWRTEDGRRETEDGRREMEDGGCEKTLCF